MSNDLKVLTGIIVALAIALIPVSAYEGGTGLPSDLDIGDIIPDDGTVGPTGIINELNKAHSDITNIMIDHSNHDYSVAGNLIFTMTVVDEENQELIVILHPVLLTLGLYYDENDIGSLLGTDTLPIQVKYGVFVQEDHVEPSEQSVIDYWLSIYNTRCTSPTTDELCESMSLNLRTEHYLLDSNNMWSPSETNMEEMEESPEEGTILFEDDFEGDFSKWNQTGDEDFAITRSDEWRVYPSSWDPRNRVAESEDCDDICSMHLADLIDLTPYANATLTFDRFVDKLYDAGEYMQIELYDDSWNEIYNWSADENEDDYMWHSETFDLESYMNVSEFDIQITTRSNHWSEDGAVDNVMITVFGGSAPQMPVDSDGDGISDSLDDCPETVGLSLLSGCPDTTPPVITIPNDISGTPINATLGFYTEFVVTATDNIDPMVVPICSHENGYFQVGATVVTCTAVDSAGNQSDGSFMIVVTIPSVPVDTDGDGFHDGIDLCVNDPSPTNDGCPVIPDPIPPEIPDPPPAVERFYGGDRYNLVVVDGAGIPHKQPSTVAIGATNSSGINGIVVSGHGIKLPNPEKGETINFSRHQIEDTLITRERVPYFLGGNVDVGFIPITNPNVVVGSQVRAPNGTIIDITQGSLSNVTRGEQLTIYGIYNHGSGLLLFKNATATYKDLVLYDMGVSLYPSQKGDSGASIIHHSGDDSRIVGVHRGGVCVLEDLSVNQPQFNITAYPNLCVENNYYYKAFTSWENTRSILNLR